MQPKNQCTVQQKYEFLALRDFRFTLSSRYLIAVSFMRIVVVVVKLTVFKFLQIFFKLFKKKKHTQSLHFQSNLDHPFFSLKMAKIEKDKKQWRKTSTIMLSKYVKIKALSPLPFLGKTRLLFITFELFFLPGNRIGSQIKGLESKFDKIL